MNLPTQNPQGPVTLLAGPVAVASFWSHYPAYITAIAGTFAVIWYAIIFTEKTLHWHKAWKRRHDNHGPN